MKKSKEIKKKTNRKHKKKILRVLVYMVLILFVLSLLFLIGYGIYYFTSTSKYNISKVEFKGNSIYDTDTLLAAVNIPMGENLYKISKKYITSNLDKLPYIESVKVKRKRPDTIEIIVKEHVSSYLAYNVEIDEYVRLTNSGIILEVVDGEQKLNTELIVFGLSFDDNIKFKNLVAETEIDKLNLYEKVNKIYNNSNIDKNITSVEFKEKNIIITLDYDINVILKDDNLDYNLNFLRSILEKIDGKAGTIDMTKTNPVFVESIR